MRITDYADYRINADFFLLIFPSGKSINQSNLRSWLWNANYVDYRIDAGFYIRSFRLRNPLIRVICDPFFGMLITQIIGLTQIFIF
jgi:hypothetical protein